MTNKEKCIEMWEMIRDRMPEKSGEMTEAEAVNIKLYQVGRKFLEVIGYSACFACLEANKICDDCPVAWTNLEDCATPCCADKAEYTKWMKNPTKQTADAVIQVVKDTWKEKANDLD